MAALALSGCMQRRGPVAYAPATYSQPSQPVLAQPIPAPVGTLDAMAYGSGPAAPPDAAVPVAVGPQPVPGPVPVGAPVPVAPPPVIAAEPPTTGMLPPGYRPD